MLAAIQPRVLRIAGLLRKRGEKIAVADGATGGLIAASILTVPGALDFFVGGGVVYSFRARDVLFDLPRDAYDGMRGASEGGTPGVVAVGAAAAVVMTRRGSARAPGKSPSRRAWRVATTRGTRCRDGWLRIAFCWRSPRRGGSWRTRGGR